MALSKNLQRFANALNSVGLVAISGFVVWESIERIMHPIPTIGYIPVIVGFFAVFANWGVTRILYPIKEQNAAIRLAYLHNLGDVYISTAPVLAGLVKTMPDSTKAIAYSDVTALLVEAIKEQQVQIDALKKQLKISANQSSLQIPLTKLDTLSTKSLALAYLDQNFPNPFNKNTTIGYYLPETTQSANIYVYDMSGSPIKNIQITQKGKGNIIINGSELRAGMYLYTLIADGKDVDTKRMILTE